MFPQQQRHKQPQQRPAEDQDERLVNRLSWRLPLPSFQLPHPCKVRDLGKHTYSSEYRQFCDIRYALMISRDENLFLNMPELKKYCSTPWGCRHCMHCTLQMTMATCCTADYTYTRIWPHSKQGGKPIINLQCTRSM